MKRLRIVVALLVVSIVPACGTGGRAAPTPAPTAQLRTGILAPAGRARDTVGRLNDQQDRQEQQTGGSDYNP